MTGYSSWFHHCTQALRLNKVRYLHNCLLRQFNLADSQTDSPASLAVTPLLHLGFTVTRGACWDCQRALSHSTTLYGDSLSGFNAGIFVIWRKAPSSSSMDDTSDTSFLTTVEEITLRNTLASQQNNSCNLCVFPHPLPSFSPPKTQGLVILQ